MDIIFFGSSPFSVPVLEKLLNAKCQVLGVVTQPDKPIGRKQILTPNPVKILAEKQGIPVYTLPSSEIRRGVGGEVIGLVAAYGRIIPQSVLDKIKIYNIHPSLLPKYRGPSPLQAQILDGITKTGVTIIELDAKMDHGPIVAQQKDILRSDDTTQSLGERLFAMGTNLFIKLLNTSPLRYEIQDDSQATYTKKITRQDGFLEFEEFIKFDYERKFRAYCPWPGIWTLTPGGKRLKLISLKPTLVQLEGKKPEPWSSKFANI